MTSGIGSSQFGNAFGVIHDMTAQRALLSRSPTAAGARPSRPFSPGWLLSDLMFMVVLCGVVFAVASTIGSAAMVLLTILVVPGFVAALIGSSFQKIGAHRDAFLTVLSSSVRSGVPLPAAVAMLADLNGFGSRSRLRTLARRLEAGSPLPAALRNSSGLVSNETLTLIQVGQKTGRLAETLELADAIRRAGAPGRNLFFGGLFYFLGILLLIQRAELWLLSYLRDLTESFLEIEGLPLPSATSFLHQEGWILRNRPIFNATFALEILIVVAALLRLIAGDRLPWFRRAARAKYSALTMRSLSFFLETERPATEAFQSLLETLQRRWVRQAVRRALSRTEKGEDWITCIYEENLIRLVDAEAIRAARRAGNEVWVLRELARRAERRRLDQAARGMRLLQIIGVVVLGALIFGLAVSFFSPLIDLIDYLSRV